LVKQTGKSSAELRGEDQRRKVVIKQEQLWREMFGQYCLEADARGKREPWGREKTKRTVGG